MTVTLRPVNELLVSILQDSASDAFEAAFQISNLKPVPLEKLIAAMLDGSTVANREAAAYALRLVSTSRKRELLTALSKVVVDSTIEVSVRSEAMEAIGVQCVTRRHSMWPKIVKTVRKCLNDSDASIVFWTCYTAGVAGMTELRSELQKLASSDKRVCPGWWAVADEASDAVDWFDGKATPDRTPSSFAKC